MSPDNTQQSTAYANPVLADTSFYDPSVDDTSADDTSADDTPVNNTSVDDTITITNTDSKPRPSLLQCILSFLHNNGDDRYERMRFDKGK